MKKLVLWALALLPMAVSAMTIQQAYYLALKNDPKMRAELHFYEMSKERVVQANSHLMPQARLQYSQTFSKYENAFGVSVDERARAYQVGLSLPVFNLESWRTSDKAGLEVELAKNELDQTRQDMAVNVVKIYLSAIYSLSSMDQARSETETYALHLKSAQEQLKKGLTNKMDVLEVESRLSQAESTLAKAKGDLDLSLLQLSRITRQKVLAEDLSRNLLNRTPGWQIKDFSSYEPVALANNLKIGEAMQRKNIAEKLVDIAHAQYYPTVELLASYSDTDSAQITSYPNYSKVMLSMSYPLYDGGLRASVGREAYERVKASEFEEQQTKLDVANRIQELVVLYKSSMIAAQSLEKSYRSSNAYLEAAELGNKVGLKSYIDVLDAEFERFRVYSSLVKTRRDLLSVYFELKIMLGESIDRLLFELSSLEAAHESKR